MATAIEAEVDEYVAARAKTVDAAGRRGVVRNGHLPKRALQTPLGDVTVQQPRVRDRRPDDERETFRSAILPPYLRKTPSLEALYPWLYLKSLSTGDFGEALQAQLKRFSNRPCTTWGGRGTSARTDAGGPMRASSMDLRERALLDSDAGMKAADVAAKYRVSGSWVRLLKQRRRETGEVAPRVQRQGRRGMLEPHLHTLAALIAAHPDRTLAELKDALATALVR